MKIISDCCNYELLPTETEICGKCFMLCETKGLIIDSNGNPLKVDL